MKTAEEIIKEAFTFKYNYKFSDEWMLDIVRITKEEYDKDNPYKNLLKELLPMAEDGYNGYLKSGLCHQEFLSEDRELLSRVRAVLAVTPINTSANGA